MTTHDIDGETGAEDVPSPWLTAAQAAQRAGRHPVVVRAALYAGELHGHQRTERGHWRVHVDSVDAWIRADPQRAARASQRACGCARVVPQRSA